MKCLLLSFLFAALASAAHAGTIIITIAGFSNLPGTPPAGWPSASVTYPAGASPNTSRTYTMNDADFQAMLAWIAGSQLVLIEQIMGLTPPITLPITPTAAQIWQAWPQVWINGTIQSTQQFHTVPAVLPPPLVIQ